MYSIGPVYSACQSLCLHAKHNTATPGSVYPPKNIKRKSNAKFISRLFMLHLHDSMLNHHLKSSHLAAISLGCSLL